MRSRIPPPLFALLALVAAGIKASAQDSRPARAAPPEGATRHLKDTLTYTVEWRAPTVWGPDTEIEVDSGRYDCCYELEPALEWYRIRRAGDHAEVLHFATGGGNDPTGARGVRLERGRVSPAEQEGLLRDLAWISSARLERKDSGFQGYGMWGCDAWSYSRLSNGPHTVWEDAWAGGTDSHDEIEYAKSRACVDRAKEALSQAKFEPFEPSREDRERILDSLPQRAYAGRPWDAFGGTEPLTETYRRLVLALNGEPRNCLPQSREEVEFRVRDPRRMVGAREGMTIRTAAGAEVPTFPWICRTHGMSFDCWTLRLEPGDYVAVLDAAAYEPRRFPLAVRRGQRATIEIDLVTRETRR